MLKFAITLLTATALGLELETETQDIKIDVKVDVDGESSSGISPEVCDKVHNSRQQEIEPSPPGEMNAVKILTIPAGSSEIQVEIRSLTQESDILTLTPVYDNGQEVAVVHPIEGTDCIMSPHGLTFCHTVNEEEREEYIRIDGPIPDAIFLKAI